MPSPFEIVAAPFTLYVAPLETAFPGLLEAPGGSWVKVGTSGDLNYMDDGVTVDHQERNKVFRALGNGGPRKIFQDEEDLIISLILADVTLEHFKNCMNQNAVTTVAATLGVAGYKKIGLTRGVTKAHRSLLLRGTASGYGDGWIAQYEVPIASHTGSPKAVWRRSDPVGYQLEFTALVDFNAASEDERFGRLLMQDTEAGT